MKNRTQSTKTHEMAYYAELIIKLYNTTEPSNHAVHIGYGPHRSKRLRQAATRLAHANGIR